MRLKVLIFFYGSVVSSFSCELADHVRVGCVKERMVLRKGCVKERVVLRRGLWEGEVGFEKMVV